MKAVAAYAVSNTDQNGFDTQTAWKKVDCINQCFRDMHLLK
jgi:hypothetical protein